MQPGGVPFDTGVDYRPPDRCPPFPIAFFQLVYVPAGHNLAGTLVLREQRADIIGFATSHVAVDLAAVVGDIVAGSAEIDVTQPAILIVVKPAKIVDVRHHIAYL